MLTGTTIPGQSQPENNIPQTSELESHHQSYIVVGNKSCITSIKL